MKKRRFLKVLAISCMSVIAAASAFGAVACDNDKDTHEHTYSSAWNNDATNHWHDATCEHASEKGNLGAHDTKGTDGSCSVCGYKPQTTPGGGDDDENNPPPAGHEHTYNEDAWTHDETNHWHAATCEHTDEKKDSGAHDTDGADGACSVCGYKPEPVTPPPAEHEHTYEEGWTHDETNHWHAANCEHTDEKKDSGAHDTTGVNGSCSVCGYITKFNELSAKTGMLISDDFTTDNAKLPEFSGTYGTQGLYSGGNSSASFDTHYIKVEGGKAQMVDPGAGETHFVVDFGLTSGVVEGYFEITLKDSANSWTPVQFVSGGSEVFGLRTDSGNIKYRLNGTVGAPLATIATSDTTYKIYFKLDGATNKLSMTIDDKDFVKDLDIGVGTFDGVRFVSSNSGSRTAAVDNLVIVNDITFAELQTAIIAKLQAVYNKYDVENKYTTNGADLTGAFNNGSAAITAAQDKAGIITAYNTAIAAMKEVKSDLAIYKEQKVSELQAYATAKGENNYTSDNWTAIQTAVTEGTANINKASDQAAADTALTDAKAVIDAVPDNSAQDALNNRDDCEAAITVPDTPQEISFAGATAKDKLTNFDGYDFAAFLGIGAGTGRVQLKNNILDVYTGAANEAGGILTVTTTSKNAVLSIKYNGGLNTNRYFIIYDSDNNIYGSGAAVTAGLPTGAYEQKAADSTTKVLSITLGDVGVYTIKFFATEASKEHKIDSITLTETKSETVTAKVNAVTATLAEAPVAGVAVAELVSKIQVQLDYNGEMIDGEITEKDQYTVIVKNAAGEVVTTDTLEAGTYSVIVIFGNSREESAATQYNSHTYSVTVAAAE